MATDVPWWRRGLISKALTRPLWRWHKARPWPVRERAFRLPPHPVVTSRMAARLLVQATPGTLGDAAWAAYSFLRELDLPGARLGLTLRLDTADPQVLARAGARWQALFPGAELLGTHEGLASLEAEAPAVAAFARINPTGRKLAVVLDAQSREPILYADSDVLLFRAAPELAAAVAGGGPPWFNIETGGLSGDDRLLAYARREGWADPGKLNSGLLFIPRGTFSLADAQRLLASGEFDPQSWFVEQTVIALLMAAAGGRPLPPERYAVTTQGQFYGDPDLDYAHLVTRHFTTPVRHLMYGVGMPLLQRRWREKSR